MPQTRTGPGSHTPGAGTTHDSALPAYRAAHSDATTRRQRRLAKLTDRVVPGSLRADVLVAVAKAGATGLTDPQIAVHLDERETRVRKQRAALAQRQLVERTAERDVWVASDDGVVVAAWLDGGASCLPS
jgi:hypothetical protein